MISDFEPYFAQAKFLIALFSMLYNVFLPSPRVRAHHVRARGYIFSK